MDSAEEAECQPGLASVSLAGFNIDEAVARLSAAIRADTTAGDCRRAALTCVRLGNLIADLLGNTTAARAWFLRARRLIQDEPPCIEQGWVAVAELGCDVDDPEVLLRQSRLALERARHFGDVNLETKALADGGLACVQAGRVAEGMAMLDEAMALACGPADDIEVAGRSVCSFFTACCYAGDFDRAGSWAGILHRHGLIGPRPGVQVFLSSHCDTVQATALCEMGRWGEAETLLVRSMEDFEAAMGVPSWHPAIALAELRIRQGRLAEAEALLLGKEGHIQALLPSARLQLARGDHQLARAMARRGMRAMGDDRLRAADLLAILVDAELMAGDLAAAEAAVKDLVARIDGMEEPAGIVARVAVVRARLLAARGDLAAAITLAEVALDQLPESGVPVLRVALGTELARLHDRAGNRSAALVEASRAGALIAGIDSFVPAEHLALLHRLVSGGPRSGEGLVARPQAAFLHQAGATWTAHSGGSQIRLANTKGVHYLAELIRNPGVERHVLDLVDRVEGVAATDIGVDRRGLGDAGEFLDSQARAAYRRRIEAVRSDIDDALAGGADQRAEDLQAELDMLVAELARAFGVGGRQRRASSASERARLNVTRALRGAISRIVQALPEAGAALAESVRTGRYCAYEPTEAEVVHWSFIAE